MDEAKEETRQEANGTSAKRVAGTIGLVIGILVFLAIGLIFLLFILQVNPLFRFEFEALLGAGPIGHIFTDAVYSASDALFGWIW